VPLGFSPVCSEEPAWTVSSVRLVLVSARAKMLALEKIVNEEHESEGRALTVNVDEHVLTCFRSWDPNTFQSPVLEGPATETDEEASADV
jgi:hypothetical protein